MSYWKIALYAMLASGVSISAASAQLNAQQIQIIQETAASICNTVREAKGQNSDVRVQGDINAQLGGLIGKLAGASAKGSMTKEEFEGLSRDATATAMGDDRGCRERVFNKMFDKLSLSPDVGGDRIAKPETAATRVRAFDFKTPPQEIKPGFRKWTRVAPDVWEQLYPDGTKELEYTIKRINLYDCDGTVVGPKTDPDFQTFFPDKNCQTKQFMFRRLSQGTAWHSYVPIDRME
jgi:hypothetical protein